MFIYKYYIYYIYLYEVFSHFQKFDILFYKFNFLLFGEPLLYFLA